MHLLKIMLTQKNTQQDTAINSKAEKADVILRDGTQSMKFRYGKR